MKYNLIPKNKRLSELAPWLAYVLGLSAAGLVHPMTRPLVTGTWSTAYDIGKGALTGLGRALTSQPAQAAYNVGGKVLGGIGAGALGAARYGYWKAQDVADELNKPVKYHPVNKTTGKRERGQTSTAKRHDIITRQTFGKARNPMIAAECIKLISNLTNKSLEESKKIFRVLYKDFVLESSKYLKENTNPYTTLKLFKGFLETEWKKTKRSRLRS